MRKLPLIEVEWQDTTSRGAWADEVKADFESAIIHTVGWKLKSTRNYILVTNQRDTVYGECSDRHKIPRGCIRNIRRIE